MAKVFAKIDTMVSPRAVVNTQIVEDDSLLDGEFMWIDITDIKPQPGVGWQYTDNATFVNPNFIDPSLLDLSVDTNPEDV